MDVLNRILKQADSMNKVTLLVMHVASTHHENTKQQGITESHESTT